MLVLKIVSGAASADGLRTEMRVADQQERLVIGRDPGCDWPIADRTLALSARHCEIVRTSAGPVLRDLSSNGTFVNGQPRRLAGEHLLRDGDRFVCGPLAVLVTVFDEPGSVVATVAGGIPLRAVDPAAALVSCDEPTTRVDAAPPAAPADRDAALRARIANGLGVKPESLAEQDPAVLAERLAALLRVTVVGVRQMNEQQSHAWREIGSREQATFRMQEAHALRVAINVERAIVALLASGDEAAPRLAHAFIDLNAHHDRLLQSLRGAMQRLGEQIAPQTLEGALPAARPTGGSRAAAATVPADPQDPQALEQMQAKARLWDLYAGLWQTTGLAGGQPWSQSFVDAALLYLGTVYDESKRL